MLNWGPEITTSFHSKISKPELPSTRTTDPIVTGAGVIAAKYRDGVMVVTDTLASYGSLARFRDVTRIQPVGAYTLVVASGDLSDFQVLKQYLDEINTLDYAHEDGCAMFPSDIHSYLGRVFYNRRNKFDPFWNEVVVCGYRDGKSFLGATDLHGTVFEEQYVANGMALHLCTPLLRKDWKPDMSEDECRALLEECMKIMYYRNTKSSAKIQRATITAAGAAVSEPYVLKTNWGFDAFHHTSYTGMV